MRTGPPMLTISIGLRLNQLRLHRGENGLALDQGQPNRRGSHRIHWSVAGHQLARLHVPVRLCQLQQNPPLHLIPQANKPPRTYSAPNFETVSCA